MLQAGLLTPRLDHPGSSLPCAEASVLVEIERRAALVEISGVSIKALETHVAENVNLALNAVVIAVSDVSSVVPIPFFALGCENSLLFAAFSEVGQ